MPLLICSSSDFLTRALIKERVKFENDMLEPNFPLLKFVLAILNESVARTQFKNVSDNPARGHWYVRPNSVSVQVENSANTTFIAVPVFDTSRAPLLLQRSPKIWCSSAWMYITLSTSLNSSN
jgi:hypothetical protein